MIGSASGVLSVANSDFSWSHRSACNQSFPECLLSLSLSATYQVFTVTFLSRRTSKVFTAIPLQLVFTPVSSLGLPAYHLQSLQRSKARSGSTWHWHSTDTNHLLGPLLTHLSKVTESHQLPGREPTPGSRGLDIHWPPYSKVAAWPAS